jgi:hypothetical protein
MRIQEPRKAVRDVPLGPSASKESWSDLLIIWMSQSGVFCSSIREPCTRNEGAV